MSLRVTVRFEFHPEDQSFDQFASYAQVEGMMMSAMQRAFKLLRSDDLDIECLELNVTGEDDEAAT